jgi:small subunit ribosomal protein S15
MTITTERKQEIAAKFGSGEQDTGNTKVQVALLTERINHLTEHLREQNKDHH